MNRVTRLLRGSILTLDASLRIMAFVCLAASAKIGAQDGAAEQVWVSKEGKTTRGSFHGLTDGVLIMKVNQQVFRVPLTNLSPESAAQARNLASKAAVAVVGTTANAAPGNFKNRGTFTMDGKTSTIFSVNVQRNGMTSYVIETVVHVNSGIGSFSSTGFKLKCQSGQEYGFSTRPVERPLKKVDGVTVMEMKLRTEVPATEDLSTAVFSYKADG
jgi:hypothetical protein